VTPCLIATKGLNREAPGSRHLLSYQLLPANGAIAAPGGRQLAQCKPPIQPERSCFPTVTVSGAIFDASEESSGKSR
jgi:hypothetical protein